MESINIDTVLGKVQLLKRQIEYHQTSIAPLYNQLEQWEVKEYEEVHQENVKELNKLEQYIEQISNLTYVEDCSNKSFLL